MKKNLCMIYKNDLKFNENLDINTSEFESDDIKLIYNDYKKKPKIELRIKDSEMENYEYLDFSNLDIDNDSLNKLFELKKIENILVKIKFLDISSNKLTVYPNLEKFRNIIFLNISNNNIKENIIDNNLIELCCENNLIESIKSSSLNRLNAANNVLNNLEIPKINVLVINNNKINKLENLNNLEYLECIDNEILSIVNMNKLQELFISNNKLNKLDVIPNLKTLNCTNNPIQKIKYFKKLELLFTSTPNVSLNYSINHISKIKKDFMISFNENN